MSRKSRREPKQFATAPVHFPQHHVRSAQTPSLMRLAYLHPEGFVQAVQIYEDADTVAGKLMVLSRSGVMLQIRKFHFDDEFMLAQADVYANVSLAEIVKKDYYRG